MLSLPPQLDQNKYPSIYRVPPFITKLSPNAYMPQVVSFGPYHHRKEHLLHMEEHKNRALQEFLEQSGKTEELVLESLRDVAQHLEKSYDALDPEWKNGPGDKFLKLMIKDGCFMLKMMRHDITRKEKKQYAPNDRMAYITPYIRRDMLLLENQLPMLVLERLVAIEGREGEDDINALILKFCSLNTVCLQGKFLHVLDVFREGLLTPAKVQRGSEAEGDGIIRSATELNEAGIQFKKGLHPSLQNVSFGGGVLRLPVITVDDATESTFLNIMTFERMHIGAGTGVTSYVTFMDNIINNERDVALLHAEGIIQNALGSDKAVAELFNKLCKEVKLESNNTLDAVQKKISAHCKKPWNRWRANLNHTYFGNPWTILSLFAAIFLFALTIIQTVYTLLSYY